jgi:hypothetical protein
VLLGGSLPWGALLAPANLRFGIAVPWAIVPMAAYLWAYWKFIRGDWGPPETAASRRLNLRANPLSRDMQGPIERRYRLLPAILVNGIAFGLLHFPNHPGDILSMLPYYIAVSAVYGGLTWAANSILPALVLHSGGDVWSLGRLWLTGRPEWQLSSAPTPLVRDTGIDAGLPVAVGSLVALTTLTIWAYASLHRRPSNSEPRTQHVEL